MNGFVEWLLYIVIWLDIIFKIVGVFIGDAPTKKKDNGIELIKVNNEYIWIETRKKR